MIAVYLLVFTCSTCLAQTSRPFRMSATAVQAYPGEPSLYQNYSATFPFSGLSRDVDVITLFPEFLGIPFDVFAQSATPPETDAWTIQMNALANAANSMGKPLMVEIVLTRQFPVTRAVSAGDTLLLQTDWAPTCFDLTRPEYSTIGTAYVNYAKWIARTFAPLYLVIMVENNLYYVNCGGDTPSWQALVGIERQAYDAVKAQFPSMIVFPSFKLEDVYDQSLTGFNETEYSAFANLKRDRLGISTYPFGIRLSSGFANPYQLPLDYLSR
ncbi:MAG TPA: hypothetical protein VER98_14355, partial [Terriglobia bacterium]|nr:hypothetical protein [Terriglobia bacterium]